MKRLILFSGITDNNREDILDLIFPQAIRNKKLAYMPSNGHFSNDEHTKFWQHIASEKGTEFQFIDNASRDDDAIKAESIMSTCNILLITGGNTYELLDNLRKSRLDRAVQSFTKKDDFVLAAFSAGAIVLGPRIDIVKLPETDGTNTLMDSNNVGIDDLTGLGIVNYEVFPHFDPSMNYKTLQSYKNTCPNEVRTIGNDEHFLIDRP